MALWPSPTLDKALIGNIGCNRKTVVKFHSINLFPILTMKILRFCRQICLFRYFYRNQSLILICADKTSAITASMIGICFHLNGLTTDSGEPAHMTMTAIDPFRQRYRTGISFDCTSSHFVESFSMPPQEAFVRSSPSLPDSMPAPRCSSRTDPCSPFVRASHFPRIGGSSSPSGPPCRMDSPYISS